MGQLRFIRQRAGMSSALTGIGSQPGICVLRGPCGSWLASDGAVAVYQEARRDVIGSHRYWVTARDLCAARALWELACQRWSSCGLSGSAQGCHRRQAGFHRYWGTARDLCAARALWELACQRWSSCGLSGRAQGCHRRQACSHRYWVTARDLCAARAFWELACQRWSSCGLSGSAQGCHRLPQVLGHSPGFMCCAGLVGAGLPAMEQLRSVRQSAAGQLAHGSRAG